MYFFYFLGRIVGESLIIKTPRIADKKTTFLLNSHRPRYISTGVKGICACFTRSSRELYNSIKFEFIVHAISRFPAQKPTCSRSGWMFVDQKGYWILGDKKVGRQQGSLEFHTGVVYVEHGT